MSAQFTIWKRLFHSTKKTRAEQCQSVGAPSIESSHFRNTDTILAYGDQSDLIKASQNRNTEDMITRLKDGLRKKARSVLEPVFQVNEIDIVAAPADSSLCIHAAAAGKPLFATQKMLDVNFKCIES